MAMNTQDLMYVEQRVANEAKSTALAYVLWFFLGILSIHRFYLGRPGTALLQILSYFILIGFVWWLVDAFLIPSMIDQQKEQTRTRALQQLRHAGGPGAPEPTPDMSKWAQRDRDAWHARNGRQDPPIG